MATSGSQGGYAQGGTMPQGSASGTSYPQGGAMQQGGATGASYPRPQIGQQGQPGRQLGVGPISWLYEGSSFSDVYRSVKPGTCGPIYLLHSQPS